MHSVTPPLEFFALCSRLCRLRRTLRQTAGIPVPGGDDAHIVNKKKFRNKKQGAEKQKGNEERSSLLIAEQSSGFRISMWCFDASAQIGQSGQQAISEQSLCHDWSSHLTRSQSQGGRSWRLLFCSVCAKCYVEKKKKIHLAVGMTVRVMVGYDI